MDIRWWHHGDRDERGRLKLSSRLLLNLIRGLPDKSEFKTHAAAPFGRDGNWPVSMQMLKHLTNETAKNRASKYAGGDHEYAPDIYLDPVEARAEYEEQQADEEFHDREFGKLMSMFD